MLEQAPAIVQATSGIQLLDIGVLGLLIKAVVDIGREFFRARQARAKEKEVEARCELEEAKAYQVALQQGKNGMPAKPSLIAFCPAHIDMVKQITKVEVDMSHLTADVAEIKSDVKIIKGAMGK